METNGHANFRWEYLIKPDRSATQQLEDLCVGLAKCIIDNEPGVGSELTPQRLAAFYRRVGGNYDTFFLKSGDHGLSFTYRTFGCFHSLQPSASPFEMPSVPCLTSHGFARWQTLQLLLTPEESVPFIQKAVELYRIPRPDGGYFPSRIPRDCFPKEPDEAMEKWHANVTGSLNQDVYMRRLKASPYQSPYPEDRKDGYFQTGPSRNSSSEDHQARLDAYRRRSSVPEVVSPMPVPGSGDRPSHWDHHNRQPRKARSHSAQRPVQSPRQRAHTTSTPDKHPRQPSHHTARPPSQQWPSHRHRISDGRSPHSRNNSASDASSENSHLDHKSRHRRSDESTKHRKSSLWPPSFFKSHRRRHSSDAGTQKIEAPPAKPPVPIPLRPDYYHRKPQVQIQQVPYSSAMPVYAPPPLRTQNGVRFRDHIFDDPNHSASESPIVTPAVRYPDPRSVPQNTDITAQSANRDSSSGSDRRHHSDWDRGQRSMGLPIRVNTVSGVSGRKYVTPDAPADGLHHPSSRTRGSAPTPV